jgi:hypothetical protein
MVHDVELVEHQDRLGRLRLDGVDIGLPHITANALERSGRVSRYGASWKRWPQRGEKRRSAVIVTTSPVFPPVTFATQNPCNSNVSLTKLSTSMSPLADT